VCDESDAGGLTIDEATAALTAPGNYFEVMNEEVLGERMAVFLNRPKSVREFLVDGSRRGDSEYAVFHDGCSRRVLTFSGVRSQAASVAAALAARGIGHGDRVAVFAANCPEYLVAFWACASLGAVTVCFNGWWTLREVEQALLATHPKLLIVDRQRLRRFENRKPDFPIVVVEEDFADLLTFAIDVELPDIQIGEDDPVVLQFTSGTTGIPKAVVVSHRSFVGFVLVMLALRARELLLRGAHPEVSSPPGPRLAVFPLFHLSGMQSTAVAGMASGQKSIWPMGRFDPAEVVRITMEEGISMWTGSATHIFRLLNEPTLSRIDPKQIVQIAIGGSATTPEIVRATEERFPHLVGTFGSGYGLTESGGLVSHATHKIWKEARDSVGYPLPTVDVRIVDSEGEDLPQGENGEICVRSPLVMIGYWEDEEANNDVFLPGRWLRTGDYGRLFEGRLHLSTRLRDLILRGGENVYPGEIESRLEEHPSVAEVAVYGIEHPTLGQEVKAVVVLKPGLSVATEELVSFCGEALAYYKVPTHFDFRDSPLPRNATGKVLKAVLIGDQDQMYIEE